MNIANSKMVLTLYINLQTNLYSFSFVHFSGRAILETGTAVLELLCYLHKDLISVIYQDPTLLVLTSGYLDIRSKGVARAQKEGYQIEVISIDLICQSLVAEKKELSGQDDNNKRRILAVDDDPDITFIVKAGSRSQWPI